MNKKNLTVLWSPVNKTVSNIPVNTAVYEHDGHTCVCVILLQTDLFGLFELMTCKTLHDPTPWLAGVECGT